MARIGFIGLGNMGLPMAQNLIKAGHHVEGFDVFGGAVEKLRAAGGEGTASVKVAASRADVVITMLPAGQQVREVYLDNVGVLATVQPGTLLIDCSTIDVATARMVADAAATRGLSMLDAPVSGGVGGAQGGTLTFMVGGSEEAFVRAKRILEAMGKTIVHAGGAGNGQAAKICNNMLLGISMIGTCEAFALAERLGLEADRFFEIASKSSGQCWSLTSYCPVPGPVPAAPSNRGYTGGFATAMMLKDLKLAQASAAHEGASTPLGAQAEAIYALFDRLGHGKVDFSGVIQMLRGRLDELPSA